MAFLPWTRIDSEPAGAHEPAGGGVGEGVGVLVWVADAVGVFVIFGVAVWVDVGLGVAVRVGVAVWRGVAVGVGVAVGAGVAVEVGVKVGGGVEVAVAVCTGVKVRRGVTVGVCVAATIGQDGQGSQPAITSRHKPIATGPTSATKADFIFELLSINDLPRAYAGTGWNSPGPRLRRFRSTDPLANKTPLLVLVVACNRVLSVNRPLLAE
jgi:hypothetical protein